MNADTSYLIYLPNAEEKDKKTFDEDMQSLKNSWTIRNKGLGYTLAPPAYNDSLMPRGLFLSFVSW
jgi:hypothetical protein